MKKYSKEIINKYILGEEIKDFSLDDLENDKEFMKEVINATNDNKIYELCSKELKKDYEFIKWLIMKFQNNITFICKVADYFLKESNEEILRIELSIILLELTKNNKDINKKYKMLTDTFYKKKRVEIEIIKEELKKDKFIDTIGLGFLVMFDTYNGNELILNYYAKKTIDAIFEENEIDIEVMLHTKFKNKNEITQNGINNFALSLIECYDPMLSSYLSCHIELMNNLKQKIINIKNNWNNYELNEEIEKYHLILDKVHEYMSKIEDNTILSEKSILYYIGNELGIAKKIAKYEGINEDVYNIIIDELDNEFFEDILNSSNNDMFLYKTLKKIILSILNDNDSNRNDNKKCKILKLNIDNNNN